MPGTGHQGSERGKAGRIPTLKWEIHKVKLVFGGSAETTGEQGRLKYLRGNR